MNLPVAPLPDDLPPGELACTLAQERADLPVTAECQ